VIISPLFFETMFSELVLSEIRYPPYIFKYQQQSVKQNIISPKADDTKSFVVLFLADFSDEL
jgi:hypothetical protein